MVPNHVASLPHPFIVRRLRGSNGSVLLPPVALQHIGNAERRHLRRRHLDPGVCPRLPPSIETHSGMRHTRELIRCLRESAASRRRGLAAPQSRLRQRQQGRGADRHFDDHRPS
jgi:hypothetical protein